MILSGKSPNNFRFRAVVSILSPFCLDFHIHNPQLVVLAFGLEIGVQEGQFVFRFGEFHKGLEEIYEDAFVALITEKKLEDPVVDRG
jgi:hypothetical protein